MKIFTTATLLALVMFGVTTSVAQEMAMAKPGPEMDIFKKDVGTWDVEIKAWQGPGKPVVTKGREHDRMLGGFWLIANFEGKMMGQDFQGHGVYSYDSKKKQYVGTWFDSLTPTKMDMVGKYDKEKKTMTYVGIAPGPDGKPTTNVLKTTYNDDGTHVMTLHMKAGDQMVKVFEMKYTKAKLVRTSKPKSNR